LQGYRSFVEPGRVAFINYGADYGKPVVVVDVANESRILVEGPDFPRALMPLKRISLTRMKMDMQRGARTSTLKKVIAKNNLGEMWAKSPVCKKLAKQSTRQNLSDLQRFQAMINRKRRSFGARKVVAKSAGKGAKGKGKK